MPVKAPEVRLLSIGKARVISVDMIGFLDAGELLTGAPTITDASGTITITNAQVSTAAKSINGRSVPTGMAVQFKANASTAGRYELSVECDTDAGQELDPIVTVQVS